MKKRTAILILTLITIFCFVPMSASAAESNVIRVSNQKEFEEAIARVNKDSDSEYTIELTADISANGFSINSSRKATILGSGHTLTMGVGGSVSVSKGAELTLGAAAVLQWSTAVSLLWTAGQSKNVTQHPIMWIISIPLDALQPWAAEYSSPADRTSA